MSVIKITDVVSFIASQRGETAENMVRHLKEKFPGLTEDQASRAFGILLDEGESRHREAQKEMDEIEAMGRVFEGLPEGTTFDDACRIKAEAGDEFAIAWLAQINSPEYRTRMALLNAAFDAHPDWAREGDHIRFVGTGEMPATLDETALIDWFQTHHPDRATQIEASISEGGNGG